MLNLPFTNCARTLLLNDVFLHLEESIFFNYSILHFHLRNILNKYDYLFTSNSIVYIVIAALAYYVFLFISSQAFRLLSLPEERLKYTPTKKPIR